MACVQYLLPFTCRALSHICFLLSCDITSIAVCFIGFKFHKPFMEMIMLVSQDQFDFLGWVGPSCFSACRERPANIRVWSSDFRFSWKWWWEAADLLQGSVMVICASGLVFLISLYNWIFILFQLLAGGCPAAEFYREELSDRIIWPRL